MSCKSFSQNFTDSTRSDSTYCFNQSQVKEFLKTKVDLIDCMKIQSLKDSIISTKEQEISILNEQNKTLQEKSEKTKKQKKRLEIGLTSTGVAVGVTAIFIGVKTAIK